MWKDLRDRGADYVEIEARRSLKRVTVLVEIPISLGEFIWVPSGNPRVQLSGSKTGAQQTLQLLVSNPEEGQHYRADITKKANTAAA